MRRVLTIIGMIGLPVGVGLLLGAGVTPSPPTPSQWITGTDGGISHGVGTGDPVLMQNAQVLGTLTFGQLSGGPDAALIVAPPGLKTAGSVTCGPLTATTETLSGTATFNGSANFNGITTVFGTLADYGESIYGPVTMSSGLVVKGVVGGGADAAVQIDNPGLTTPGVVNAAVGFNTPGVVNAAVGFNTQNGYISGNTVFANGTLYANGNEQVLGTLYANGNERVLGTLSGGADAAVQIDNPGLTTPGTVSAAAANIVGDVTSGTYHTSFGYSAALQTNYEQNTNPDAAVNFGKSGISTTAIKITSGIGSAPTFTRFAYGSITIAPTGSVAYLASFVVIIPSAAHPPDAGSVIDYGYDGSVGGLGLPVVNGTPIMVGVDTIVTAEGFTCIGGTDLTVNIVCRCMLAAGCTDSGGNRTFSVLVPMF